EATADVSGPRFTRERSGGLRELGVQVLDRALLQLADAGLADPHAVADLLERHALEEAELERHALALRQTLHGGGELPALMVRVGRLVGQHGAAIGDARRERLVVRG